MHELRGNKRLLLRHAESQTRTGTLRGRGQQCPNNVNVSELQGLGGCRASNAVDSIAQFGPKVPKIRVTAMVTGFPD